MVNQSLFSKPKSKRLARIISIKSPSAFRNSIRILNKGGMSLQEKKALVLAKNRAGAQLKRRNLSPKERREFTTITKTKIPNRVKRRKK